MITIAIPISRSFSLNWLFQDLEELECDIENTKLLIYIDGDIQLFQDSRDKLVASKYKFKECKYRRKGLPNVSHVINRRKRIAEIHNEMKELVSSDFVFLMEDDTIIQPDALTRLIADYEHHPEAGFISGVQIGRWGFEHIGAWQVQERSITSVELGEGVQEVDAAGLYCCLTRTETYKSHNFTPFEKILGPDFDFGIKLKEQGYKNYVDYAVKCKHLTKRGAIDFTNSTIIQVGFEKNAANQWLLKGQV